MVHLLALSSGIISQNKDKKKPLRKWWPSPLKKKTKPKLHCSNSCPAEAAESYATHSDLWVLKSPRGQFSTNTCHWLTRWVAVHTRKRALSPQGTSSRAHGTASGVTLVSESPGSGPKPQEAFFTINKMHHTKSIWNLNFRFLPLKKKRFLGYPASEHRIFFFSLRNIAHTVQHMRYSSSQPRNESSDISQWLQR